MDKVDRLKSSLRCRLRHEQTRMYREFNGTPDRYPMDVEQDGMVPRVMQLNVANLYNYITGAGSHAGGAGGWKSEVSGRQETFVSLRHHRLKLFCFVSSTSNAHGA